MTKSIYAVTGAAGYLGSHVVDALLNEGFNVRALILKGEKLPEFINKENGKLEIVIGNVTEQESLESFFYHEMDKELILIHCAGIISIDTKEDKRLKEVNVKGTKNIIALAKKHQVKRLVYVSSVHAIPLLPKGKIMKEVESFDPKDVIGYYAKSKAEASQAVLDATKEGLDAVIVHPSGIIGPNSPKSSNMTTLIFSFLKRKLVVAVKGGFDFVDVRDVADGIVKAATKGRSGQGYILSHRFVSLKELFKVLQDIIGKKRLKLFVPKWMAKLFAPFAEIHYHLWKLTPTFTRYSLHTVFENGSYSHKKATQELGYKPRSLKETLTDMVATLNNKKKKSKEN